MVPSVQGWSFPGIWVLLNPFGSSVTFWEMRGVSDVPQPGQLLSMTKLGLGGASEEFLGACPSPTTLFGTAFVLSCPLWP